MSTLQFFAWIAAWTMICIGFGGVMGVWYAKKKLEDNISAAFEVLEE